MKHLLLVGCGRMGSALLSAWLSRGMADAENPIYVVDPTQAAAEEASVIRHVHLHYLPEEYVPDVVVFAVKPQELEHVLPLYASRFGADPLYVSIAAGKPLAYYAKHLEENARVIRAMPNLPALTGQGMTALIAGRRATHHDRAAAEALFAAVGTTLWLESEEQMHAATALSGSGPAYIFLFMEALVKAGAEAGLPEADARAMALQTMIGSCALVAESEEDVAELRRAVTSPGGTTEAALKALAGLPELIKKAVNEAVKRSKELAET